MGHVHPAVVPCVQLLQAKGNADVVAAQGPVRSVQVVAAVTGWQSLCRLHVLPRVLQFSSGQTYSDLMTIPHSKYFY